MSAEQGRTLADVERMFHAEKARAQLLFPEQVAHVEFGGFNGRKLMLGLCDSHNGKPRIRLSKYIVRLAPEDIIDTIRHELAHVVAGIEAGHGSAWRAAAVGVGALPERCSRNDMMTDEDATWFLVVRGTREVVWRYVGTPRLKSQERTFVTGRKAETLGRLELLSAAQFRKRDARSGSPAKEKM